MQGSVTQQGELRTVPRRHSSSVPPAGVTVSEAATIPLRYTDLWGFKVMQLWAFEPVSVPQRDL